ncbi:MAG: putative glycolipid-binding domain-containing protein, partial [Chloroflexota bacterium]
MQTIIWKALEYPGMEHLFLDDSKSVFYAHSVVIAAENPTPFRLDYIVKCDGTYAVREVNLSLGVLPHGGVYLTSDGQGNWFDRTQKPLPELAGCIDVDISATPFTNTLPIRRIQWQVGQTETFRMVYILVPGLKLSVMRQRYTCLEKTAQGATFRYENVDDDF